MALAIEDWVKLAPGHDNEAGLLKLAELNPPMFTIYSGPGSVLTDWHNAEEYKYDGLNTLRGIGLPYSVLQLTGISPDEFVYLTGLIGPVTAWLYNKYTATWGAYNGTLDVGTDDSRTWDKDQWDKVTVNIRFLREI